MNRVHRATGRDGGRGLIYARRTLLGSSAHSQRRGKQPTLPFLPYNTLLTVNVRHLPRAEKITEADDGIDRILVVS